MKAVNHLSTETSPYLLQHVHNPVDWYPWGEEALERARREDKAILVSIGYSACHWCHVMERESFEDEETAALMNTYFINIKIDREERPDLDHIYMDAVQAMAGSGGWPLNVFLTPEGKPFYGGTYFPPVRAFNRASWKEVLMEIYQLFKEKRQEVEAQAEELTKHIGQSTLPSRFNSSVTPANARTFFWAQANTIFNNIMKQADRKWGGFGSAPKFPQTFTIKYLLRYHYYSKNETALTQARLSLDKMIYGGIFDQLGGGFARYSTDAEWLAPHFEKMLYDNALIISALCDAYQLTGNTLYRQAVDQTVHFITKELMNEEGGFYSALDADSEGVEGKYYVWTLPEVVTILGNDAPLFCRYYDVTENGNWEQTNILRTLMPLPDFIRNENIDEAHFRAFLKKCTEKLLTVRNKRIRPQLDDKILLGWNALMNTALSKAAAAFGEVIYKDLAIKNLDFLWSKFAGNNGSLHHTFKNGQARYPAFLDDYAYLIDACLRLQEITSDAVYLQKALQLTQTVMENFSADDSDFFYYTGKSQEDVIIRKPEIYDGAIPSANSVMAGNLLYLSVIFDKREWHTRAINMLKGLEELIAKYPVSFANWASLAIDQSAMINEIAIVGKDFAVLRNKLMCEFIPNKVIQCAENGEGSEYPLLLNKKAQKEPVAYLCRNYSCSAPENNVLTVINDIRQNINYKIENNN